MQPTSMGKEGEREIHTMVGDRQTDQERINAANEDNGKERRVMCRCHSTRQKAKAGALSLSRALSLLVVSVTQKNKFCYFTTIRPKHFF